MNHRVGNARGMSIVYIAILMAVLCAMLSLAVDLGRVQVAKGQLRAAADAAARAGAAGLETGVTSAQDNAINAAAENVVDGTACNLDRNHDVDFGTWDSATKTFNPLTGANRAAANAIRINAERSQARGSAIPLLFAKLVGRTACDVHATAIAMRPDTGYGVVGLDFIRMGGNSSDSYWATGPYVPGNYGAIASNGSISLSGKSYVHGDARPGVGQQVYGAPGRVAGSIAPLASPLVYLNANAGLYAFFNNNGSVPPGVASGSSFSLGKNKNATLPGGTYYFNNFSTHTTSTLAFTGPATIYVYGTADFSGQTTTKDNLARNLNIVMCPSTTGTPPGALNVGSGSDVYANIYAPQSAITMSGSGDIWGSVVGKSVDMTGSSAIHYDLTKVGGSICLVQ